ncbi:MAG TPA: long-chain fatty acid--CoA ligase [Ignavibacteria bacterium]|nr:long-chain fatty acid--CoA ligase [Ignavibacteria bacterium]
MDLGYNNFTEFFQSVCKTYGNDGAIYWKDPNENKKEYKHITGSKLKELTYLLARAIEQFGIKPGETAAIISETRFEWVVTDFACIAKQIVTVPVYPTMTSEQIRFILLHSESRLCFVSTQLMAEKVNAVFNELPKLEKIITFNKTDHSHEHIISFEELIYGELLEERTAYSDKIADEFFIDMAGKQSVNDLLTIIYTSGTTGIPKGVCLSHKNVLANVKQCTDSFPVHPDDIFLSFLPLAHTYERTGGYYVPLSKGAKIYYAKNIDTLAAQMAEVKPTIVLAVPMLFTRIASRVQKNIEQMPLLKRTITKRALKIGKAFRENKSNPLWKLADKRVFSVIRERTGGRIKFFISGGSALSKETAEFFDSIGVLILQGYGMTEASPVISVNRLDNNEFGTVGPPLENVNVKIAGDGEILVQGDNVMLGYFKNPKDTDEMIISGWLHTGDIGIIDDRGMLKITDRKKTLIKTATGKYISLTHIEENLERSEYISQVISFASDEKDYVTALIVPDQDMLESLAKKLGVQYNTLRDLTDNDVIHNFFESEIDVLQKPLAKYERVRKFALLEDPFTIESGELTPTMKLKRKVIEEKHRSVIEDFYN